MSESAIFRPSGSSEMTWAMNQLFEHLLGPGEGDGRVGVALVTQEPGFATPLHRHHNEAEAFLILEGTMTYRAGDEMFRMSSGDFVWLPQDVPHAFRVTSKAPAKVLALTTPAGLLGLYDQVGMPAQERRLPGGDGQPLDEQRARWAEIGPKYGLEIVGPPIPPDE